MLLLLLRLLLLELLLLQLLLLTLFLLPLRLLLLLLLLGLWTISLGMSGCNLGSPSANLLPLTRDIGDLIGLLWPYWLHVDCS